MEKPNDVYGYIYKITNKNNGKCYIGQTIKNPKIRWIEHLSKSKRPDLYKTKFLSALRKYGKDGFIWEIIDESDTEENLNNLEMEYIKQFNSVDFGYNILEGGFNAPLRNKKVAKKVSNSLKKHFKNTDNRAKLSFRQQNKGLFGFTGVRLMKQFNPETKCWQSRIKFNRNVTSLGLYNDPLSGEIVYKLTQKEIFGGGDDHGAY